MANLISCRNLLGLVGSVSLVLGLSQPSSAWAAYPSKPVRLVVPFAAGGGMDVLARAFSLPLSEALGVPVIVDNKPGAGSIIGTTEVARSKPDGYTVLMASIDGVVIQPLLHASPPYDPVQDLTIVAGVASTPVTIAASNTSGFESLADLLAAAKSRPDAVRYASPGVGSILHLAGEWFASQNGIQMTHVAYRGGGPAVVDVMGGHIELLVSVPSDVADKHSAGALKVLAQMGEHRHPSLPDVSTLGELGQPGLVVTSWVGLAGPGGLPEEIKSKLADATNRVLQSTKFQEDIGRLGFTVMPMSAADLDAFSVDERERWQRVIQEAQLSLLD